MPAPESSRIHAFTLSTVAISNCGHRDWWEFSLPDLEKISGLLLKEQPNQHTIRHGDNYAVIASVKLGSLATKLEAELAALTMETRKILAAEGVDAILRAAAFYHLRFENIHPLVEGNGRIGRTILAAQLHQALGIPVEETFAQLNAHANDYMMVFPSNDPAIQFELMLDVLARLTGHVVSEEATKLPASILPLYPDRRPLLKHSAQQKRPVVAARPPQKNNYFRRFG